MEEQPKDACEHNSNRRFQEYSKALLGKCRELRDLSP